eukprot:scaffold279218_cov30-Tisochrysis_lutea.AAC.2
MNGHVSLYNAISTAGRTRTSRVALIDVTAVLQTQEPSLFVSAPLAIACRRHLLRHTKTSSLRRVATIAITRAAREEFTLRLYLHQPARTIVATHTRAQVNYIRERLVIKFIHCRDRHPVLTRAHGNARTLARDVVNAKEV